MTNLPVLAERKTVAHRSTTALDVIQASNPPPLQPGVSVASVVGIGLAVPAIAAATTVFMQHMNVI